MQKTAILSLESRNIIISRHILDNECNTHRIV
jgi:hypothetical protein